MADTSIGDMVAAEAHGQPKEYVEADWGGEDPVRRWRSVAVFGGLVAVEGGIFTMVAAGDIYEVVAVAFVLLALLIIAIGSLVVPWIGGGYGWAVVGAALIALVLGLYLGIHPVTDRAPVGSLWAGGSPAEAGVIWTLRLMEGGGLFAFVLGVVQAVRLTRKEERD